MYHRRHRAGFSFSDGLDAAQRCWIVSGLHDDRISNCWRHWPPAQLHCGAFRQTNHQQFLQKRFQFLFQGGSAHRQPLDLSFSGSGQKSRTRFQQQRLLLRCLVRGTCDMLQWHHPSPLGPQSVRHQRHFRSLSLPFISIFLSLICSFFNQFQLQIFWYANRRCTFRPVSVQLQSTFRPVSGCFLIFREGH